MRVLTFTEANVRTLKLAAFVLMGAVGFVLLLVRSNVASLVLARSSSRRWEITVRTVLGAGRGRLIRQILTESVALAVVGGVLGVGLAYFGTAAVADITSQQPFLAGSVEWSTRVLIFSAAVSVSAGVLFGLFPALQNSAFDIQETLKTEGSGVTSGVRRLRLQRAFVVVEVGAGSGPLRGGWPADKYRHPPQHGGHGLPARRRGEHATHAAVGGVRRAGHGRVLPGIGRAGWRYSRRRGRGTRCAVPTHQLRLESNGRRRTGGG